MSKMLRFYTRDFSGPVYIEAPYLFTIIAFYGTQVFEFIIVGQAPKEEIEKAKQWISKRTTRVDVRLKMLDTIDKLEPNSTYIGATFRADSERMVHFSRPPGRDRLDEWLFGWEYDAEFASFNCYISGGRKPAVVTHDYFASLSDSRDGSDPVSNTIRGYLSIYGLPLWLVVAFNDMVSGLGESVMKQYWSSICDTSLYKSKQGACLSYDQCLDSVAYALPLLEEYVYYRHEKREQIVPDVVKRHQSHQVLGESDFVKALIGRSHRLIGVSEEVYLTQGENIGLIALMRESCFGVFGMYMQHATKGCVAVEHLGELMVHMVYCWAVGLVDQYIGYVNQTVVKTNRTSPYAFVEKRSKICKVPVVMEGPVPTSQEEGGIRYCFTTKTVIVGRPGFILMPSNGGMEVFCSRDCPIETIQEYLESARKKDILSQKANDL